MCVTANAITKRCNSITYVELMTKTIRWRWNEFIGNKRKERRRTRREQNTRIHQTLEAIESGNIHFKYTFTCRAVFELVAIQRVSWVDEMFSCLCIYQSYRLYHLLFWIPLASRCCRCHCRNYWKFTSFELNPTIGFLLLSVSCFVDIFSDSFSFILLFGRYMLSNNTNRHSEQNSCRSLILNMHVASSCVNRMHGTLAKATPVTVS